MEKEMTKKSKKSRVAKKEKFFSYNKETAAMSKPCKKHLDSFPPHRIDGDSAPDSSSLS